MQRVLEFLGTRTAEAGETCFVAEADQGVAPVVVMPAVPRVDRRRNVRKRDLVIFGYTDECQACTPGRFFTTTDAEIAQVMMIRDKESEFRHALSPRSWRGDERK